MSDREDYKIYVGNLKYDVTERQVRQYFEHYGKVDEVFIATDRYTRRPKGYCFVTFQDIDDAKDAIHDANNKMFAGREINVHRALPKRATRYDDRRRRRSPSPRRRSRSPQRRSKSPRRTSRSPRRRSSISPQRQMSGSPRRQSNSPRKRSPSPRGRSNSPKRRSASGSPRRKSTSPGQ